MEFLLIGDSIEKFKSYFSFAIVRNPWDWQVSLYTYALRNEKHGQHKMTNEFGGFDNYIEWRCDGEATNQKDFIYTEEGTQLVDYIGRFEALDRDFETICSKIGVTANLPKINVYKEKEYKEYYNKHTMELVRKTFESDIHLFNYDF